MKGEINKNMIIIKSDIWYHLCLEIVPYVFIK